VFILLAVLLFVATEGLLYYRWATTNEPTCVLVIDAGVPLRGAEIRVSGPRLPEPYTAIIGDKDRFSLPFYLEPDRYTVTITRDGKKLLEGQVELTWDERGKRWDLTQFVPPPTTNPSTNPASAPQVTTPVP
jgi:hypothetical protein